MMAMMQCEVSLNESASDTTQRGYGWVIVRQPVVVGVEQAADADSTFGLLDGGAYRTEIGPGETRIGHGLLFQGA